MRAQQNKIKTLFIFVPCDLGRHPADGQGNVGRALGAVKVAALARKAKVADLRRDGEMVGRIKLHEQNIARGEVTVDDLEPGKMLHALFKAAQIIDLSVATL
jgi:hypothetical protein